MDVTAALSARAPVMVVLALSTLAALLAPRLGASMASRWPVDLSRDSLFWRNAAAVLLVAALGLVSLSAGDYGYNVDESFQSRHGRDLFDWYANAATGERREFRSETEVMNFYGGSFELLAEAGVRLSPLDATTTRHLMTAWFAVLGLVFAYLLGHTLHSRAAGFASVFFLLLYPRFYGHFFSNPKDVPFAVAMLLALVAVCRSLPLLPRLSLARIGVLGCAIGFAMGVRAGGVLALLYFALALGGWLVADVLRKRRQGEWPTFADSLALVRSGAGVLCMSWLVMLAFWPWAQTAPLSRPLEAVAYFQDIVEQQQIDFSVFFAGRYYLLSSVPRSFTLEFLAVTLPEVLLTGLALGPMLLFQWAARGAPWRDARNMARILTALAVVIPLATTASHGIIQYDGIRHFLFVVPPAVVCFAVALVSLLGGQASLRMRSGLAVAVLLLSATTAWDMWRLHPYQYTYFNRSLAGGLRLAADRYETDYLGLSYREGVRWAVANYPSPPGRPARITICKGWNSSLLDALASEGVSPASFRPVPPNVPADLAVAITRGDCHRRFEGSPLAALGPEETPLVYVIDLSR